MVLEFEDPVLEARYKQQFAVSHRRVDALCSLVIWVAGMVAIWKVHRQAAWWELALFWTGYPAALGLVVVIIWLPAFYVRWREWLLCPLRLMYVALGIILHEKMYSSALSTSDWSSFTRNTVILGGQWAQQLFLSTGYHMRVKVHIMLQLCATVMLSCSNHWLYTVLAQHQNTQEKLQQLEDAVNDGLQWVLPGVLSGPIQLGEHFCVWFWGFMQIVVGCLVTSKVIYSLELRQRKAFVAHMGVQDVLIHIHQYFLQVMPLMVLLPSLTVVLWYYPMLLPYLV